MVGAGRQSTAGRRRGGAWRGRDRSLYPAVANQLRGREGECCGPGLGVRHAGFGLHASTERRAGGKGRSTLGVWTIIAVDGRAQSCPCRVHSGTQLRAQWSGWPPQQAGPRAHLLRLAGESRGIKGPGGGGDGHKLVVWVHIHHHVPSRVCKVPVCGSGQHAHRRCGVRREGSRPERCGDSGPRGQPSTAGTARPSAGNQAAQALPGPKPHAGGQAALSDQESWLACMPPAWSPVHAALASPRAGAGQERLAALTPRHRPARGGSHLEAPAWLPLPAPAAGAGCRRAGRAGGGATAGRRPGGCWPKCRPARARGQKGREEFSQPRRRCAVTRRRVALPCTRRQRRASLRRRPGWDT